MDRGCKPRLWAVPRGGIILWQGKRVSGDRSELCCSTARLRTSPCSPQTLRDTSAGRTAAPAATGTTPGQPPGTLPALSLSSIQEEK